MVITTSPSRDALQAFLRRGRELLQLPSDAEEAATVRVVMGSESADMDSVVSALALSYFWTQTRGEYYVPMVNVRRSDMRLRQDVRLQLSRIGILDDVLCIDEVDLAALAAAKRLQLTIVDHNHLKPAEHKLDDCVVAVIDHHADSGQYMHAQPRIIEMVGSCVSLVFREAIFGRFDIDPFWATLLLGPILLDTANLNTNYRLSTQVDRDAVELLAKVAYKATNLASWAPELTHDYYMELMHAKMDTSALSSRDLLRQDYKQWNTSTPRESDRGPVTYGMATVTLLSEAWEAKDNGLVDAIHRFAIERGLRMLICMLYTYEPAFQRELLVYWPDPASADPAFLKHLETSTSLQLTRRTTSPNSALRDLALYNQANLRASRKQVQPLVHAYFQEHHP